MNINPAGAAANPAVSPQIPLESAPQQQPATAQPPSDTAANAAKEQPTAETQEASDAAKSDVAKPDAAQAKPAANHPPAASQVEVTTKDILSGKLAELTKVIEARTALIASLPENIQNALKEIFRQGASTETNLPDGLANLLKSQNMANKQLTVLANLFDDAARLANENQGGKLTQLLEKLFPDKLNTLLGGEQQKLHGDPGQKLADTQKTPADLGQKLADTQKMPGDLGQKLADTQKLPGDPGQKLADTIVRLNSQDISPGQLRQALQTLAGEFLAQNTSLPKNAQQLPQLLFSQNAAPLPPELAKLAETVKQPDLTLLWTLLQTGSKGNNSLPPEQAQQKLLDLVNQLTKDQTIAAPKNQPAPNPNPSTNTTTNPNTSTNTNSAATTPAVSDAAQSRQAVNQILPGLLTTENAKLLEIGSLLKNMAGQNTGNAPPLLAQMAKETNMPELLQLWNLTQTLSAGGGRNFTLPLAATMEQNLTQLAGNLLAGNISAAEAKDGLDVLMNSFKGFRQMGTEEEQLARNFLRQTLTSLPPQIQQAAVNHNMPELTRAWLLTKLANLEACREQAAAELKLAAANIRTLSSAMQRSATTPVIEHQSGNSVLSLTTPLYFGEGQAYPAHIHIYQEYADGGSPSGRRRKKPETWVRITLDTENIGPVDAFFRLYDQHKLDVRVRFQEPATASEFGEYLPEIRRSMKDSSLELTDLSVRSNN